MERLPYESPTMIKPNISRNLVRCLVQCLSRPTLITLSDMSICHSCGADCMLGHNTFFKDIFEKARHDNLNNEPLRRYFITLVHIDATHAQALNANCCFS